MSNDVLEKYSPRIILSVGLIICSLAVICYDCLFIYRQFSKEYYSENTVLSLTEGTYKSSDGHSVSVDASGNILYDDTYSLILASDDAGNKINGNIGSSNTLISLYQISNTTLTTIATVTYTDSSGSSVVLNGYTSFVLENSTPVVLENGVYEVWSSGSKVNTYADLQSAVDAATTGDTVKITDDVLANSGVYINKNITIDGGSNEIDTSSWKNAFFVIEEGATVNINNLIIDGGATGFIVDYDAITYTDSKIPLVSGSDSNDVVHNMSAIISKGNLNTDNIEINNNYTSQSGAAINVVSGTINMKNSLFEHNRAKYGGAVYVGFNFKTNQTVYPVDNVVIEDCEFTGNYSSEGGALYLYNLKEFSIKQSTFDNNVVNLSNGGAISINRQGSSTASNLGLDFVQGVIDECVFKNNWAGNDGFAISNSDAEINITNSSFISNYGVHSTSSVATYSMNISRSDGSWATGLVENCSFVNNYGAISGIADHGGHTYETVKDCYFSGNDGSSTIYILTSKYYVTNCKFVDEKVTRAVIEVAGYSIADEYVDQDFVGATMVAENLTFSGDNDIDLFVYQRNHDGLYDYTPANLIIEGVINGNVAVWDDYNLVVNGIVNGNIITDSLTPVDHLTINGIVNGEIYENDNSSILTINYKLPTTTNISGYDKKYIYLENDKEYTKAEIYMLTLINNDGYAMELYTDSTYTTAWDYKLSANTVVYAKWVEHTHTYNGNLILYNNGIYSQCECGNFDKGLYFVVPSKITYDGTAKTLDLVNDLGISKSDYSIVYYKKNSSGEWKKIDGEPVDAGYYLARLTYNSMEIEEVFEILEKIESPDTGDNVVTYIIIAVISILVIGIVIGYLLIQKKKNKIL